MPTDIVMPQMGESIVEGTITKWLKKPGDKVQRDEPLFEISTDKVDAEIPAPASGVLAGNQSRRRRHRPGEYRRRHHLRDGEAAAAQIRSRESGACSPNRKRPLQRQASAAWPAARTRTFARARAEEEDEQARSSPLVRKIAREHNVNLSQVSGTGLGGRITKQDIMAFIEGHEAVPRCRARSEPPAPAPATAAPPAPRRPSPAILSP